MTSEPPLPELSLDRAIELARDYLQSSAVDLSQRLLLEARWIHRSTDDTWCWALTWMTANQLLLKTTQPSRRGGGMLEVLVVDENQVSHSVVR